MRGSVLAGKYVLERVLGHGGMGNVWAARHLQLDALVAVKLIHPAHARDPVARARFEREARAAARLRSQHVVQVHDHGIDGENPFMVMELLEGEDLHVRLRDKGRLSLTAVAGILSQVAKGLGCAHEAGVVHRDLKPANVFLARVDGEEVVKILDFGVAKSTTEGSCATDGALVGSPEYMSPEQARSDPNVGPPSDLWSLAAIVFRAVTGAKPFGGAAIGEVIHKICHAPIPRVSDFAPDLPPELDAFFARAFDRNPSSRFAGAREMAAAFAGLVGSRSSAAEAAPASAPAVSGVGHPRSPEIERFGGTLTQVYRPITVVVPPRRTGWQVALMIAVAAALFTLTLGGLQVARWRASAREAARPAADVPAMTTSVPATALRAASPARPDDDIQVHAAPAETVAPALPPARRRAPRTPSAPSDASRGDAPRSGAPRTEAQPPPAAPTPRAREGEERLPVIY